MFGSCIATDIRDLVAADLLFLNVVLPSRVTYMSYFMEHWQKLLNRIKIGKTYVPRV